MANIAISGDTSGAITLAAPAVSGTSTLTLPSGASGTIAAQGVSTNIVSGTAQASTSGTSIDFTGIPSWVKKITVMFSGVSTNGTSNILVQIGSGSVTTSGYQSAIYQYSGATASSTAGFLFTAAITAAGAHSGSMILTLLNNNLWTEMSGVAVAGNSGGTGGGTSSALGGALDRVRVTTVNGTDTFDAGSINILYE